MGSTYRFISDPNEPSPVLAWFRDLPAPPEEGPGDDCVWLHFAESDPLTEAWGREHHLPEEEWTVDPDIGRVLRDADDD